MHVIRLNCITVNCVAAANTTAADACYDQGRDTLYPRIGWPIKPVLVGTHVCCLPGDRTGAALFFSRTGRLRAKLVPTPLFHLGYASQLLQIRSQCLNSGNYRAFSLIKFSTITLAHSDEPYIQNCGKFVETPLPRAS